MPPMQAPPPAEEKGAFGYSDWGRWLCFTSGDGCTSWWFFTNLFLKKYALVKLDHFPRVRGENKKSLS